MIRLFGMNKPPLTVLWEREKIFKLLSGTDSQHLQKNYKSYTIDPKTRYSNLSHGSCANIPFLKKLYDTDDPEKADYSLPETLVSKFEVGRAATMNPPRNRRKSSEIVFCVVFCPCAQRPSVNINTLQSHLWLYAVQKSRMMCLLCLFAN